MLKRLELLNFAIVSKLEIDFDKGLNILSGETGAGKSIVVDALNVLSGSRMKSSYLKKASDSALVQGLFENGDSASRRLLSNGRSNSRINTEIVNLRELSEKLGKEINIFGQHSAYGLSNPKTQQELLDNQLSQNAKDLLSDYKSDYDKYKENAKKLELLKSQMLERTRNIDILKYQIDEIEAAKLDELDYPTLESELKRLRNSEKISSELASAINKLTESNPNAGEMLAEAVNNLHSVSSFDERIKDLAKELESSLTIASAVSSELINLLDNNSNDTKRLEEVESQMAEIDNLMRKYGSSPPEVLKYYDKISADLQGLLVADETLDRLEQSQNTLLSQLQTKADALHIARQKTAKRLSKQVTAEIKQLAMPNAVFEIKVEKANDLKQSGKDEIHFDFSANLGIEPGPIATIASGGELSRLMLAINVVASSQARILVFDEVDSGIGGKTAIRVAELLKKLAQHKQVIVVTHLPQIAAYADKHLLIVKHEKSGETLVEVNNLTGLEREQEIARMLSGNISQASLANARELLEKASV